MGNISNKSIIPSTDRCRVFFILFRRFIKEYDSPKISVYPPHPSLRYINPNLKENVLRYFKITMGYSCAETEVNKDWKVILYYYLLYTLNFYEILKNQLTIIFNNHLPFEMDEYMVMKEGPVDFIRRVVEENREQLIGNFKSLTSALESLLISDVSDYLFGHSISIYEH